MKSFPKTKQSQLGKRATPKKKSFFAFNMRGMTLLEILVSVSIFAFMFVFISQMLHQSYRQAKKIKTKSSSLSLFNVLELMRQDFSGIGYFLDINENFEIHFAMNPDQKIGTDAHREQANQVTPQEDREQARDKISQIVLSPYFVFEGKNDEIHFVSYSFSNKVLDRSSPQWLRIHYSLEDCKKLDIDQALGLCLVRKTKSYWNIKEEEDADAEETFVLLRGLKSLEFSYTDSDKTLDKIFHDDWKVERIQNRRDLTRDYPRQLPFPNLIKMEMKVTEKMQQIYFPISFSYLKNWNPYSKSYDGFPVWTVPKKQETTPKRKK